jgi:hypothetical protein
MKVNQLLWSLGLVLCVTALCLNLYILHTLGRFSVGRVAGVSLIHLYCAYYYWCRISGRNASLVYAVKTLKDERELVGRDVAPVVASLLGVLFAAA